MSIDIYNYEFLVISIVLFFFINKTYNTNEMMNPVNQDKEYKKFNAGTQYPINATNTPKNNAIIAALLNPVFP